MDFNYEKKYRAVQVNSKRESYVHDCVRGSFCSLGRMVPGERGWFRCSSHDESEPWYTVHTSVVKSVDDDGGTVTVRTENTVYVFELAEA